MTSILKWAEAAKTGRDSDRKALINLVGAAGGDDFLHPTAALQCLTSVCNLDCDRAWRVLERLEKRGLIKIAYSCGVPASLDFCVTGACDAV